MNKQRAMRRLVMLNAILLATLAAVTFAPLADAQRATRARGDYTMVAGRVQGLSESAIYVVDAANQELIAVRWDRSRSDIVTMGYRDLAVDGLRAPGGGR